MLAEQLWQIWRRYAPPFFSLSAKNLRGGGVDIRPPGRARVKLKQSQRIGMDSVSDIRKYHLLCFVTVLEVKVISGHQVKKSSKKIHDFELRYMFLGKFSLRTRKMTIKHFLKRQNRSKNKIRKITVKVPKWRESVCFWHVLWNRSKSVEILGRNRWNMTSLWRHLWPNYDTLDFNILTQCVKLLGQRVLQVWWWYLLWLRRYRKKTRGWGTQNSPQWSAG